MGELDLIPSDYRQRLWLRNWARRFAGWVVLLLLVLATAFVQLQRQVKVLRAEGDSLRTRQALDEQQRAELLALQDERAALGRQLEMLKGLQSGIDAELMFTTIDAALGQSAVWFRNWEFRREGVIVPEEQPGLADTGYFIVVPADGGSRSKPQWMVETHMMIRGRAADHAALSRFVTALFRQPGVVDARVQKTVLVNEGQREIVDFDLAVVLRNEAGG